jgi:type II secretory pathway pseudopilin PulG
MSGLRPIQRSARAGFTLLEVVISATLLFLLAGSLVTALDSLKGVTTAGSIESKLQQAGERALLQVVDDMKRSGFVTLDLGAGVDQPFPYLFDGADATFDWQGIAPPTPMLLHSHVPPTKQAQAGDPDFGLDREIVFLLPADDLPLPAGDGVPDVDGAGNLVWDLQQVTYTVSTRAGGINHLERSVNGANPTKTAMHVERVTFDDNASSGGVAVPLGAIRVQIFLRQVDDKGQVHRFTAQATVRMRNG